MSNETKLTYTTALFATLSVSNWYLPSTGGYFSADAATNPLLHTWSLGVEEQFYLVFPVLMFLALKSSLRTFTILLVLLLATSFGYNALHHAGGTPLAHYSTMGRVWELALGALMATSIAQFAERQRNRVPSIYLTAAPWVGISILAFLYATTSHQYELFAKVGASLATALLIWSLAESSHPLSRLLRQRTFVWIGLASYSIYLWHQPIMAFARLFVPDSTISYTLATISATLVLAALTYRFVEKPVKNVKLSLPRVGRLYLSAVILVVVIIGTAAQTKWFGYRYYGHQVFQVLNHEDQKKAKSCGNFGPLDGGGVEFCVFEADASETSPSRVAIWGDSHAMSLTSGFISMPRQYDVVHLGVSGCDINTQDSWEYSGFDCRIKHRAALERILGDESIRVVVFHSRWVASSKYPGLADALHGNLDEVMQTVKASGREIIVVTPIPTYNRSIPEAVLRSHRTGIDTIPQKLLLDHVQDKARIRSGVISSAEAVSATILMSDEVLCPKGVCITEIQGRPLYYDANHLTVPAAQMLAERVDAEITSLLGSKIASSSTPSQ